MESGREAAIARGDLVSAKPRLPMDQSSIWHEYLLLSVNMFAAVYLSQSISTEWTVESCRVFVVSMMVLLGTIMAIVAVGSVVMFALLDVQSGILYGALIAVFGNLVVLGYKLVKHRQNGPGRSPPQNDRAGIPPHTGLYAP